MAQRAQNRRACTPLRDAADKGRYTTPPRPRGPAEGSISPPPGPRVGWNCSPGLSPPPAPRPPAKPFLLRAIERGLESEVRQELLRCGSGISSRDNPRFEPALCCAVRSGAYPEILRLLLRHGANVNEVNQVGHTALDMLCALNAPPPLPQPSLGPSAPMNPFASLPWQLLNSESSEPRSLALPRWLPPILRSPTPMASPSDPLGWSALHAVLNGPAPLPPLLDLRSWESMSFPTDPLSAELYAGAEIMPSTFPLSWDTMDPEVTMLSPLDCFSAAPFTRFSSAFFSDEQSAYYYYSLATTEAEHEESRREYAKRRAEREREREERLVQAGSVLLAAGAEVHPEVLSGAAADSQPRPHRFPRFVQLVQGFAAGHAYRIVSREVVKVSEGAHGNPLGQILGDHELLRQVCSFLAPEGCCFWAIEPRGPR
eukprot:TRINITY_DN18612_c0_g1_i1.p1 TRINITY_DN18612_c0_g1~~TRINITY_DN18612_c0_g1_i1.p1  ORF type:complete len:428 (-),score=54.36 TRINITY_DN18612_c0_g1_i1:229-1512(-)